MLFGKNRQRYQDYKAKEAPEDMEELELEKGDKPAIFIAALLVFLPAALLFGGLIFLIYFLFVGF